MPRTFAGERAGEAGETAADRESNREDEIGIEAACACDAAVVDAGAHDRAESGPFKSKHQPDAPARRLPPPETHDTAQA